LRLEIVVELWADRGQREDRRRWERVEEYGRFPRTSGPLPVSDQVVATAMDHWKTDAIRVVYRLEDTEEAQVWVRVPSQEPWQVVRVDPPPQAAPAL
jgi:hypothetical protein